MITDFAKKHQLPAYRVSQFNKAFYQELVDNFDQLTTWPKNLREELKSQVPYMSLAVELETTSKKGDTTKILFKRDNGQLIETVIMRHQDGRNTICVSCMRGCPVNCSFCATGKLGYGGRLSAEEIVDQVLYCARLLKKDHQKVSNIVFMGMGEPMLNLDEVQAAIAVLTDKSKFGLGNRRITISTSGYIPQFEKLVASGFRGRVAISLHAPNQTLRAALMPVARIYPLSQLMKTLDAYVRLTNKRISYEYIMIDGVNDQPKHAHQLVKLLGKRLAHINLIPCNPITGEPYKRSSRENIHAFTHILSAYDIEHSVRVTMGDDINAACGQLAASVQS